MNHTLGPWEVVETETGSQYTDAKGKYDYGKQAVLVIAPDDCQAHPIADTSANHTCRTQEECEANARLIAAAPDLLKACRAAEMALRDGGTFPINGVPWMMLSQAIEKANG